MKIQGQWMVLELFACVTACFVGGCGCFTPQPVVVEMKQGESLKALRDRVRALPFEVCQHGVEVRLTSGMHVLPQPLVLEAADSGTMGAPVVWRGAKEGRSCLVSGVELQKTDFQALTDPALRARLPAKVANRILVADLSSYDFVMPPKTNYNREFWGPLKLPDVFLNGKRLQNACFPATGWCEIAQILDKGTVHGDYSIAEARKRGIIATNEIIRGGTFRYAQARPGAWQGPVMIECFWAFDWRATIIWTKQIDAHAHTMTMCAPHQYGIKMGNPRPRRWRALNVFEELETPGRYVVDGQKKKLYLNPPDSKEAKDAFTIGLCGKAVPIVSVMGGHDIVLSDIDFDRSWSYGVKLKSSKRVVIERVNFRNQRNWAIYGTELYDCTIRTCNVTETGDGCFFISGGDRKKLVPGNNEISDCLFENWGALRSSCGRGIEMQGCGNRAVHNLIRNANGYVVTFKQNDGLFAYNVISNTTWGVDDAGAFYKGLNPSMCGNRLEYNYWRDIGAAGGHGSSAIYFDDGDSHDTVYGNVFENCGKTGKHYSGFAAVFSHGGCSNICQNCLFVRCDRALGSSPWKQERWEKAMAGRCPISFHNYDGKYRDVGWPSEIWKAHYPFMEAYTKPYPDVLRWNAAFDNVFVDCPAVLSYEKGKYKVPGYVKGRWYTNETDIVVTGDPGFQDYAKRDYRLRKDSEIYRRLPTFKPIPFEKFGLLTPR